jgi:hypothetical protein
VSDGNGFLGRARRGTAAHATVLSTFKSSINVPKYADRVQTAPPPSASTVAE